MLDLWKYLLVMAMFVMMRWLFRRFLLLFLPTLLFSWLLIIIWWRAGRRAWWRRCSSFGGFFAFLFLVRFRHGLWWGFVLWFYFLQIYRLLFSLIIIHQAIIINLIRQVPVKLVPPIPFLWFSWMSQEWSLREFQKHSWLFHSFALVP